MNQLLLTLRFYATGEHQLSIGDFVGAHQTTVSRIIYKVSNAIADLCPRYVKMPSAQEQIRVQNGFYEIARFPRVLGCIDGTHIKIQSPGNLSISITIKWVVTIPFFFLIGGEDPEIFRNRKSYFSVNTQILCDSNLKILDIVADWPGSTHDVTIFNSSRIKARFENGEFNNGIILGKGGSLY